MKVFLHHSPTSFLVESDTRPEEHHLVELLNYNGFGECSCEHFHHRIEPGLKEGFPEKPCKHIIAAKFALADRVLMQILENMLTESAAVADLTPPQPNDKVQGTAD